MFEWIERGGARPAPIRLALLAPLVPLAVVGCSDEGYLPENMSDGNPSAVDTVNEQSLDVDYGNNASGEVPTEGGGLTES